MIRVSLRAHPAARAEKVLLQPDGSLAVWVRAPARDGRANTAVLGALAGALGLRARQVRLLRGERGRDKLVELDLPSGAELRRRLSSALAGPGG
jgi:uncharacterized protein YggU (UPF0235/DUF167 family)